MSVAEVRPTFSQLTNIRTLSVAVSLGGPVLDTMGCETTYDLTFPSLQTLHLQEYDFGRSGRSPRCTKDICHMLHRRAERDYNLEKLVISRCRDVEEEELEKLGRDIGVVVVRDKDAVPYVTPL